MAKTIVLTSPEQRELFGLTETVLIPSQKTKKHQGQSRRGRGDTQQLILRACHHRELSIREIAKELDRSKCPWLRNLVYEMCQDGLLTARQDTIFNGLAVYKFIAR